MSHLHSQSGAGSTAAHLSRPVVPTSDRVCVSPGFRSSQSLQMVRGWSLWLEEQTGLMDLPAVPFEGAHSPSLLGTDLLTEYPSPALELGFRHGFPSHIVYRAFLTSHLHWSIFFLHDDRPGSSTFAASLSSMQVTLLAP